ncbi:MAG TPA: GNAT family N-acetyltransferase, partial [Burkholderiales bacterium]|nr:GNAT family N-acetyltransferase [Burkholderiales bacterium]
MIAGFVIAPLAAAHDRQTFSCGAEPLDRYLQTQATQDVRRHIANCFVASPVESNVVAGYYTLSAASIPVADLPEEQTRKLPRTPVLPAALIGRLAVD